MSKLGTGLKAASLAFLLPVALPVVGTASAVGKMRSGNFGSGLLSGASVLALTVAANHWIANPQANVADSIHLVMHPDAAQITRDVGNGTEKWASGAFSVAAVGLKAGGRVAEAGYNAFDRFVNSERTVAPKRADQFGYK